MQKFVKILLKFDKNLGPAEVLIERVALLAKALVLGQLAAHFMCIEGLELLIPR